ncbi:hypothetical protein TcWFU_002218 [Taenia crassiceps]|uniref:Uncharacterized protein n=1 Tax=Taenia crassiceps TaxID=6207 RepID=A0ABR4QPZ6_9CEST
MHYFSTLAQHTTRTNRDVAWRCTNANAVSQAQSTHTYERVRLLHKQVTRTSNGNTKGKIRGEALYDSEDLARHMANYVMNQIPTLSVTHISSSDIIAPDIWSDPFRVYACLFAKASRVLFLVTQYDVAAFGKFTREHLQPLLNQSTPRDYDWKSRFFVLAMGELDLPVPLPCEIIRFREVGWFRDSMALFVLGKKIQEFWTPKQLSSCLITRTEKLKFATNLEETETFQTSLIVKNSNDEDPIDKRGDVQEIFNTKIDHGSAMISNDGPHYIACQNFNVRFDIVSNRSLEIHNLLIPNVSVSGLSGTIQPLQTNVGYYAAQSDIGLIGISSDMDDISPALGEVHSTTDSAGEMQWSPPDSVSVVRETESNSALSPNEGGLTPVTTETDRIRSDVTQTTVTEKASVAAGNADFILESEPPKPTKRTRMVGDQVGSRSIDLSSVRKQHTFFTHERDAPISLSGEDIRSPTTANTSPEGPLETIAERSVESDTSLCPLDCCGFPMQPIPGVQKSEQSPCSDGLETMSTVSRQISPSDYLKIEDGNAITSPKLDSNKKFTPLMGSQCFGEKDEFLKDIESTEIKLQDRKSPSTPFLSLLETTSEESAVVPKTTKTALMDSDFPSGTKKRVSPHGDLNSSGDKIKCFDVEGSSQVDIDVDLKTSNVPNIRQTSPSISFLQKEGVASTSNSMNLIDKKNKENCGDLDHAGSETDENRSAAPSTSESVPQNYAFHPPNKSAPRRGLWESRLLTIEATKEKIPDASSKISICHKHTIGSKLGERQDSVEGSSGQVRPTDIFENECRSPISDSDCDPEITSSTMSRPSCLLSADNFPSSIALPKTLPEAATSQADCLKLSILRGAEVIKRRERLEEHKPNIEKRFSSISITDEVNQREFEVADTAVGSSYSELGDFRLPSASSVGLLHEAEKFDNDGGPSTYWCDRSVGSPTPCGFSARSDTTSDSSVPSEKSRVFIEDAEITTNSRQRTVNALFSVCKALGKASKLLSFSNEIIMRQIEQLNSEQP